MCLIVGKDSSRVRVRILMHSEAFGTNCRGIRHCRHKIMDMFALIPEPIDGL